MDEVTQVLTAIDRGEKHRASDLLPLVYEELRKLAAYRLAQEQPGQTLQATALVHDAYLRIIQSNDSLSWDSRGHFFAAAAEAMRRILLEHARRKRRHKHGGKLRRLDIPLEISATNPSDDFIIAVDESLDALSEQNAEAARLVKLRFFAGLTQQEAAKVLNIPSRSADRLWAYAKAWLYAELQAE